MCPKQLLVYKRRQLNRDYRNILNSGFVKRSSYLLAAVAAYWVKSTGLKEVNTLSGNSLKT